MPIDDGEEQIRQVDDASDNVDSDSRRSLQNKMFQRLMAENVFLQDIRAPQAKNEPTDNNHITTPSSQSSYIIFQQQQPTQQPHRYYAGASTNRLSYSNNIQSAEVPQTALHGEP